LRPGKTDYIMRSNDRPDLKLAVRPIQSTIRSYDDLNFLIPVDANETNPPPRFVVFCDSRTETEQAAMHLRDRLPARLKDRVKYYHAVMSNEYRETEAKGFMDDGGSWGLIVTDAFGMGVDMTGIAIVVQWRARCDASTLIQRFGRGARGSGEVAWAVLLAEKKYFDDERAKASQRRQRRRQQDQRRKE
ncbi:P-loop containing nucleoside triphosphate hydrolase protein, partial [Punctularia strigosozonata HHB-11173 SS5]|uniref:P-loop containing nucleoside triphosphate hydrolase protein n=1 Tax=Punctularia strigosozonata (strain HHB-11173) TaxID=741275 RepID=UPI0004416EBC